MTNQRDPKALHVALNDSKQQANIWMFVQRLHGVRSKNLKSKAAVSNWKSMRMFGTAGGSLLLLPNRNKPAPLRGVKPSNGRVSVLASASTFRTPTLHWSLKSTGTAMRYTVIVMVQVRNAIECAEIYLNKIKPADTSNEDTGPALPPSCALVDTSQCVSTQVCIWSAEPNVICSAC